ncbi:MULTISPECIES: TetR/AcrR family transcriptional regulator [Rhizobium/Agrobacterium group]|uniref:TetR/AcrR family transcriptional regulator n=2 Tax=Neorhizobium TaxID=1525371 RepID=A0ABV0MAC4_9HYPH|nr:MULTISPECIES: TetR/AcrR family transcriptional regulator [Rhizobium/Agrobacterium group]KGD94048.1 transcriptional regulator [Rhizobium sp. YS-1r]MCC2613871.1 TetR/AcrR family transcriptional regulator [Neorhizobium petrolearium]WGI71394.1 TetR/AcrR family transcriptional regulator [Neorhizobium petrolearium]
MSSVKTRPSGARRTRTQSERSSETRQALFDATIALLHDQGFNKMSTPEIARKAGVSRGALTHHFATKEDLVISAVADHLTQVNTKLAAFADTYGRRGGSTDEIVDYLWRVMFDRLFYVTLEYLPEARHNEGFRAGLIPVVHEFHDRLDAIWTALAAHRQADPASVRIVMNATMCLIRGMIAQTVLRPADSTYYETLLEFWKQQVRDYFSTIAKHSEPQP